MPFTIELNNDNPLLTLKSFRLMVPGALFCLLNNTEFETNVPDFLKSIAVQEAVCCRLKNENLRMCITRRAIQSVRDICRIFHYFILSVISEKKIKYLFVFL